MTCIPCQSASKPPLALTIGMACHSDFDGVWFTVQSLRLSHPEVMPLCEILVIDNSPDTPHGQAVQNLVNWCDNVRYIPAPEVVGTAVPRDRVFREARAPNVLVLDSHVLLAPGSLAKLIRYYEAHPETNDLLQGPMLYDDLRGMATHMKPEWRSEMFGVWDRDERGADPDNDPFEIPMHGLGLFSCRKAAWPGFNPAFRGFGGEEGYIHEKFRRRGGRTLCLPFLRWAHRFGRPNGVAYPLTRYHKVRNYILGRIELGLPYDDVISHFYETAPDPPYQYQAYGEVSMAIHSVLHPDTFQEPKL
jgi:hypothetical protein